MAQSSTILKESFQDPLAGGLQNVIRGQMLQTSGIDEAEFEEDLSAINLAVAELIRLEALGKRLNLSVEDIKTYEALETIAERFREFGLSNRFSETIISAIEDCAINNGVNFARKNKSEILTVRLELTDQKPDLTKGRNHFMIAFDGKQKHGAQYSTVETHFTSSGTKTTTTSMPDLENMFVNKIKYLVFAYESHEGEALNSPENVQADLNAIAASGALPANVVEELQAALDTGSATPQQIELIQAVAELGRVMALVATPGAVANPAATIERLKDTIAQIAQSPELPAAMQDAAQQSIQKMVVMASSPMLLDIVAQNDNQPAPEQINAEIMEILEQAGLGDAMAVNLTTEQQAALHDLIQDIDMPVAEQAEILSQIAEGALERDTFSRIEALAVEAGAVLPAEAALAISDIRHSMATIDISDVIAGADITLSDPQKQALEQLVKSQEMPAADQQTLLAQIEAGVITRENFSAIEKLAAESPAVAAAIGEIRDVIAVQDKILPVLAEQKIFLTEDQQQGLEEIVATQDLPQALKDSLMDQIETKAISIESISRLSNSVEAASPVLEQLKSESRQVVREQQSHLDISVAVPLTPYVKDAVIDAIARMNIPESAKQTYINEIHQEMPSRSLVSAVSALAGASPALNAFHDQASTHFLKENAVQMVAHIKDYTQSQPASAAPATKMLLDTVVKDLQAGRPVSWANQIKIAQVAPDLSVKMAGTQTFAIPVRNPQALIAQMKEVHREIAKSSSLEAKAVAKIIATMESNPQKSPKILENALRNMPVDGKLFARIVEAGEKIKPVQFQPHEGQREKIIATLTSAKTNLSPQDKQTFDRVIMDLQLGNPIDRQDLDKIVEKAPDTHIDLSLNLKETKQEVSLVTRTCVTCPQFSTCGGKGCEGFKPAASVEKATDRDLGDDGPQFNRY